ncbi:hypothetical protein IF2G_02507 [Cordyceps javanica]|nr:hypothetical protein IF2G_02507 [Cordyceps javanica]
MTPLLERQKAGPGVPDCLVIPTPFTSNDQSPGMSKARFNCVASNIKSAPSSSSPVAGMSSHEAENKLHHLPPPGGEA